MTGLGPGEGTWKCHVCGRERPDALISVHKNERELAPGSPGTENVRDCNDSPSCIDGAKDVTFMGERREPGRTGGRPFG